MNIETVVSDDVKLSLRDAKLQAMAEFAAGAGHEINNPLATISGRVQLLLRTETDPQKRHVLNTIGGQVYRIRDMIGDAMLFGRPPEPDCQQFHLAELLKSLLISLSTEIEKSGCQVELISDQNLNIWGDHGQLNILFSQLLFNSLSASTEQQNIKIECQPLIVQSKEMICCSITDWGCGISSTEAEHLFDPFYSGRQAGRGLGFGLSKCWQIARMHQGEISYEATTENGTCFKVILPANEEAFLL